MILVFGSINFDLIFPLERLPEAGETLIAPDARLEPGGKGANQAIAAARDGARVAMAGAVGTDALADAALAGLRAAGVGLTRVARVPGPTGCAAICTDPDGRNQIAVGAGANRHALASQVEDSALGRHTTLVVQMEAEPAQTAALIHRARARGARIVLNFAPARVIDPDALRAVDVLLVNESEAGWLAAHLGAGHNAASLQQAVGGTVIRTRGAQGAEWATADETDNSPVHLIEPVDTTAAGDCFTGVLAAALDRGASLRHALGRASAAAALACTRPGSQGSIPTTAETDAFVAARHRE